MADEYDLLFEGDLGVDVDEYKEDLTLAGVTVETTEAAGKAASATSSKAALAKDDAPSSAALYLSGLEWWKSDQDIIDACKLAGHTPKSVVFYQFPVNGLSRGLVYVEFERDDDAAVVKEYFTAKSPLGAAVKVCYVHATQIGSAFVKVPKNSNNIVCISEELQASFK